MFLEDHFNVYCDDAKQNAFHTKSLLETWHEGGVDEGMPLGELEKLAAAVAETFTNTKSSHPEGSGTCVESNTTDGVDATSVVMSEIASYLEPALQKESRERHQACSWF